MGNENADNERKKHHRGRRRKKKGNIIANVILVIALIVFCVSGFQLFKIGKGYLDGRSEYDKVRKLAVTDDKNKNDKDKNHSEDGDDTFSVDFQKLLEINPDTIAWIRFPDEPSQINYPVVQGTDNSKYLKKTFSSNENTLGAIFLNVDNQYMDIECGTVRCSVTCRIMIPVNSGRIIHIFTYIPLMEEF